MYGDAQFYSFEFRLDIIKIANAKRRVPQQSHPYHDLSFQIES